MTDQGEFREFTARLFRWDANPAMTLVSLPEALSDEFEARGRPAGFGSLKVEVECGPSSWTTSVFPDSRCFVLPVKKAVRVANGVEAGDVATFRIRLVHR